MRSKQTSKQIISNYSISAAHPPQVDTMVFFSFLVAIQPPSSPRRSHFHSNAREKATTIHSQSVCCHLVCFYCVVCGIWMQKKNLAQYSKRVKSLTELHACCENCVSHSKYSWTCVHACMCACASECIMVFLILLLWLCRTPHCWQFGTFSLARHFCHQFHNCW